MEVRRAWRGGCPGARHAMRIADGVEGLELAMTFQGRVGRIHPLLLWGGDEGATLVDTGFPGQFAALEAAITACGVGLGDIRRVVITHQDIDHIGNLPEVVRASGARVWAHAEDAPYIQGDRPLLKANPQRLAQMLQSLPEAQREQAMRLFGQPPRAQVDEFLADGEELPWHGGVRVLHTPGHTPGHVSLLIPSCGLLVSGDELRVEQGELMGPNPANTPDTEAAGASLRKLAGLADEVDLVLCYHGGLYGPDAGRRLRELAG